MKGVNPKWENLPRRKCDNCGKSYKPKQPLREGMRGFCCGNCRKEYHKHGGAYAKLRPVVEKMVRQHIREAVRAELNWIICNLPEGACLQDWTRAVSDPVLPSSRSPRA